MSSLSPTFQASNKLKQKRKEKQQKVYSLSFYTLKKKNMETMGAIPEGEFYSFNRICSDKADFMAKLFNNCSSTYWPSHESIVNISGTDESLIYSSDETNTNLYSFSQGSGYNGGNIHENYYPNNFMTMNYCMTESNNNGFGFHVTTNNVIEGEDFLNQDVISNDSMESNQNLPEDVRKLEPPMLEALKEDKVENRWVLFKKRPQISGEVQRKKRSMKLKKCFEVDDNDEANNNNNVMLHRQRSSSCCSEDDSNASTETRTLNLSRKTRASKGSATDPQSLYARKRRERINERLRILQNLVPNGTKVDISTMLEEAVLYVKFLQLQIKLLSSDEHWMYSPIAYNGMDIGLLDLQIPTPKSQTLLPVSDFDEQIPNNT